MEKIEMKKEYTKENIDYVSKLLLGKPIEFEGLKIWPLTIKEIQEYSFEKFNWFLSVISYNDTDIMETLKAVETIPLYDFIMILLIADETNEIKDQFLTILNKIFREEVCLSQNGEFIVGLRKALNRDEFMQILEIIKDQNFVKTRKETILTKKQREYKEMVKKAREKHKAYVKAMGDDGTDMLDLVSSVASKHSSINLFNIDNLTIYQLIDQFKRLNAIDEYFINIDSLLAGADKKNLSLQHWSKKIE